MAREQLRRLAGPYLLLLIACLCMCARGAIGLGGASLFASLQPFNATHSIAQVPDLAALAPESALCIVNQFSCYITTGGAVWVSYTALSVQYEEPVEHGFARQQLAEQPQPQQQDTLLQAQIVVEDVAPTFLYLLNSSGSASTATLSVVPATSTSLSLPPFSPTTAQLHRGRRSSSPTGAITFKQPASRLLVLPETASLGFVLTTVVAVSDTGAALFYSLAYGSGFAVDNSGAVSLASNIQAWNKSVALRVVVRAADSLAVVANTSFLELVIKIEDINYPYFLDAQGSRSSVLTLTVQRNSTAGAVVATLDAFDDDQSNHSLLQYTLTCNHTSYLALSLSGVLSVQQPLATTESITDCSVVTVDWANPARNSTTTFVFLPTSMYIRTSQALCGPAPSSVATAQTELQNGLNATLSFFVRIISVDELTSPACNGTLIQLQSYCYSTSACSTMLAGYAPTQTTDLWVSLGLSTTASVIDVLSPLILQPTVFGPTPPYQRAPVVYNASIYGSATNEIVAADLAAAVGVDYDTHATLTIAVSSILGVGQGGRWVIKSGANGTIAVMPLPVPSVAQSVVLLSTDRLQFQPAPTFHGLAALTFKLFKAARTTTTTSISSSSSSSSVIATVDTSASEFLSYGNQSEVTVISVGIVFPPDLMLPTTNAASFALPTLSIQFRRYPASGTPVASLVTGTIPLDASITDALLTANVLLVSLLPATEQARYAAAVAHFNDISRKRSVLLASGGSVGIAVIANNVDEQGAWQFSPTKDQRHWVELASFYPLSPTKALLLSSDCTLRFTPASGFAGTASLSVLLWDGSEGHTGTTLNTTAFPGSFSTSDYSLLQTVARINTRPTASASAFALPTISYSYLETNQFVSVFTLNESLASFTPRTTTFINLVSVMTSTTSQQIRLLERDGRAELALKSFDLSSNALLRAVDVIARFQANQLLASSGHFPFNVVNTRVLVVPVNNQPTMDPSTFATNTGASVAQITHSASSDPDTNTLGLAVIMTPNVGTAGVWLYRLPSMVEWQTIPPTTERRAFLLPSTATIRFAPTDKYFGPSSLQTMVWDQSALAPLSFANVLSNSLSSPFSEASITLTVQRAGCDGVADSLNTIDACGSCVSMGNTCQNASVATCAVGVVLDSCGVCGGDGASCAGCNNVPFSGLLTDNCGVCAGSGASKDCNGDCFGAAMIDACGMCVNGSTGRAANGAMDCAGFCNGSARLDDCGSCVLGTTGLAWNMAMDCRGSCGGTFVLDNCGVCKDPLSDVSARDCAGSCFGSAVLDTCALCVPSASSSFFNATMDACGVCSGNNQTCMGCDLVPNSRKIVDQCGVCGGNSTCLKLSSVTPNSASIAGGVTLSLFGSGFVGSANAVCKFKQVAGIDTTIYLSSLTVVDRARASCSSPVSTVLGQFSFSVTMDGTINSNTLNFTIYNFNAVSLTSLSFVEALTTDTMPLLITGTNFVATNLPRCFYPELNGTQPYPGLYINATSFSCPIPRVTRSVALTPLISFNGVFSEALSRSKLTLFKPSAKLTSAVFNEQGTHFLVSWDQFLNISLLTNNTCNIVFDTATVKLLRSSTCAFVSFTTLLVSLSGDAKVFVGTSLTMRRNTIFLKDETYSRPCFGSILVARPPIFALAPTAVLQAPLTFTTCGGNLTVTGRFSSGGGYAPLRFKFWVQTTANARALEMLIASTSSAVDTLNIPTSLLVPGEVYYFFLQVTNFVGTTSPVAVSQGTTVSPSLAQPTYQILGHPTQTFSYDQQASVVSGVSAVACYPLVPLSFAWTIDQCLDSACSALQYISKISALPNSTASSGPILDLDALSFTPNTLYRVQQFIINTDASRTTQVPTSSITIVFQQPQLSCAIIGGSRLVSSTSALTLQVTSVTVTASTVLSQWSYKRTNGLACSVALSSLPSSNSLLFNASFGNTLVVPANTLQAGSYIFSVQLLGSTGQTASCSSTVTMTSSTLLAEVFIQPLARPTVWNAPVLVSAWIKSSVSCTYQWTCATSGGRFCPVVVPLSGNTSSTSSSIMSFAPLTIPAGSLVPSLLYTFQLAATCSGVVSTASIDLAVVSAPHGGTVLVSNETIASDAVPIVGRALFTNFTFTAVGWTDDADAALPLRYALAIRADGQTTSFITPFVLEPVFQVWLPAGAASRSYAVDVTLVVENMHGAQTNKTIQVTVLPWFYLNTTDGPELFSQLLSHSSYYRDSARAISLCASVAVSGLLTSNAAATCASMAQTAMASSAYYTSGDFTPLYSTVLQGIVALPAATAGLAVPWIQQLLSSVGPFQSQEDSRRRRRQFIPLPLSQSSLSLRAATTLVSTLAYFSQWNVSVPLSDYAQAVQLLGFQYCRAPTDVQSYWNFGSVLVAGSVVAAPQRRTCVSGSCSLHPSTFFYSSVSSTAACLNPSLFACSSPCFVSAQLSALSMPLTQLVNATHSFARLSDIALQYQYAPTVSSSTAFVSDFPASSVEFVLPAASSTTGVLRCCFLTSESTSESDWACPFAPSSALNATRDGVLRFAVTCALVPTAMATAVFAVAPLPTTTVPTTIATTTTTVTTSSSSTRTTARVTTAAPTTTRRTTTTTLASTTSTSTLLVTIVALSKGESNLVAWILVPLAALAMFVLLLYFARKYKAILKVGASTDSTLGPDLHPSYTRVLLWTTAGDKQELEDFHLPLSARLLDARQALKTALPLGALVYFVSGDMLDVSLLVESNTTVGEIMMDGVLLVRDVSGLENTKRQFCVCGSVADYECSRCENQGYCSEACQKKHWQQHLKTCFPQPRRPPSLNQPPRPSFQKRLAVPAPIRPRVSIANLNLETSSESDSEERPHRSSSLSAAKKAQPQRTSLGASLPKSGAANALFRDGAGPTQAAAGPTRSGDLPSQLSPRGPVRLDPIAAPVVMPTMAHRAGNESDSDEPRQPVYRVQQPVPAIDEAETGDV